MIMAHYTDADVMKMVLNVAHVMLALALAKAHQIQAEMMKTSFTSVKVMVATLQYPDHALRMWCSWICLLVVLKNVITSVFRCSLDWSVLFPGHGIMCSELLFASKGLPALVWAPWFENICCGLLAGLVRSVTRSCIGVVKQLFACAACLQSFGILAMIMCSISDAMGFTVKRLHSTVSA